MPACRARCDESYADRISNGYKNNWCCVCGDLRGKTCRRGGGDENSHVQAEQFFHKTCQLFLAALRPARFEDDIFLFSVTELAQALTACLPQTLPFGFLGGKQIAYTGTINSLRSRRERPRRRCATDTSACWDAAAMKAFSIRGTKASGDVWLQ